MSREETIGTSTFAESCLPNLQCGGYAIRATHATGTLGNSAETCREFFIEGPRFSLAASEIQSFYPPAGMTGSFGRSLPHIVFTRKTLPWERTPDALRHLARDFANAAPEPLNACPWMAILTLSDQEILEPVSATAEQAVRPQEQGTYFPALEIREEEKKQACAYIDIDKKLFLDLMPAPDELPFLCHARCVDSSLKSLSENLQDDYRAVLVGNRLAAAAEEGIKNRCYLVSFEGFGDYFAPGAFANYQRIRLITLSSWDFTAITQPYHFGEMFSELSMGSVTQDIPEAGQGLRTILAEGFAALPHQLRNGDHTVSFYRGPLTTGPTTDPNLPASNADSLYRYDPALGMFDVSHAVAWQLGRLLALNNPAVSMKIMRKRGDNHRAMHRKFAMTCLEANFGPANGAADFHQKNAGLTLLSCLDSSLKTALEDAS
jgi:hypothetical protein